ncbi:MAG: hypothetical protein B6245_09205 [Desulfobacteraceae bacterium 4572_88]|nr:MAG: hypothetical protein B6245_09205 [Desulfobacteraceae bacterium 4572_88]
MPHPQEKPGFSLCAAFRSAKIKRSVFLQIIRSAKIDRSIFLQIIRSAKIDRSVFLQIIRSAKIDRSVFLQIIRSVFLQIKELSLRLRFHLTWHRHRTSSRHLRIF